MRSSPTVLLEESTRNNGSAAAKLAELVYDELRDRARQTMKHERIDHTLQPTALVHEVYERMVGQTRIDWKGRTHFIAVAVKQMHRILVDHARRKAALKHGGGKRRVKLSEPADGGEPHLVDLLDLEDALGQLAAEDPRAADVVELRYFGGLSECEVAKSLGVSERTVRDDWSFARVWLRRRMGEEPS